MVQMENFETQTIKLIYRVEVQFQVFFRLKKYVNFKAFIRNNERHQIDYIIIKIYVLKGILF